MSWWVIVSIVVVALAVAIGIFVLGTQPVGNGGRGNLFGRERKP